MMYKAKMSQAWARLKWCEQQFGPGDWYACNPDARWWRQGGYVCFHNERDYLFYLLKWA